MKTHKFAIKMMSLAWMLLITIGLTACGVKSSPQHPKGASYPRQYPEAFVPLVDQNGLDKIKGAIRRNEIYRYPNTVPIR